MPEKVSDLLLSTDESERRRAVAIIARGCSKESLGALVKIAEYDVSADVRYFARRAVGAIKDSLKTSLVDASSPPSVPEKDLAAFFAGEIGDADRKILIIRHLVAVNSKDSLGRLVDSLQTETDPAVISTALIAIGKFGSENEIKVIARYLSHENSRVRANAVEALELVGSMKAYPHIMTKLSDEDNRVRGNAVSALRVLGAIDTMRIIRLMAESGRQPMQATAAYALRFFPRDENVGILLKLLKNVDGTVRKNVFEALRKYSENGIKRAGEILSKTGKAFLGGAEADKRDNAGVSAETETLARESEEDRIFRQELKSKINAPVPPARIGIIKEAMEKGILGIAQIFHERLKIEKDDKVIATLVHALGKLEFTGALATLVAHLKHSDVRVRANAVEAIGLLSGRDGVKAAVVHLVPFLKDSDNRARANAVIALAREKNAGIYATLLGMIRSGEKRLQKSAIYAIMELKDPSYYEFLAELERSPKADDEVRLKAKTMTGRLAEEGVVVRPPDLAERGSRTFRIFVSSTFSDTRPERDHLQKKIFPQLRDLCGSHGYRFQAVDLRWGVTSEAAYDQQTMKICLDEIRRSKRVSPRPNFIILLGDRYGWLPLPYEIPQNEFETALEYLGSKLKESPGAADPAEIKTLLDRWYRLDENADPPAYCLAARDPGMTGDMPEAARNEARKKEEAEWNRAESLLHGFFAEVCEKVNISQVTRLKLKLSATAQEIVEGAVLESTAKRHVFAFMRTISGLPAGRQAKGYADLDLAGNTDAGSRALLKNVKERLRRQIPNNIFEYESKWIGRKDPENDEEIPISTDHIEKFGEDVRTALANAILDRIASDDEIGPLEREIMCHDKFGSERSGVFIGRAAPLKKIRDYAGAPPAGPCSPLMVWGVSGCGKTAIMAKAASELSEDIAGGTGARPENAHAAVVISRFVGATAGSFDVRSLLKSICDEIKLKFDIAFEKGITADMRHLPDIFNELLARVPSDKVLAIFIDALDQLIDAEGARSVSSWLPCKIPANVKIVVSTLKGRGCFESLENALPPENIVEISGMSEKEGEAFLKTWLSSRRRKLAGEGQYERVMAAYKKCPYPLYFKLLLEEASLWRSFDGEDRAKIGGDYEAMIGVLFDRLSRAHGRELVGRCLGYLSAARNGLAEDEMIEILTYDDEFYKHFNDLSFWKLNEGGDISRRERIPVVIWSKLYFDLAPYLAERTADGTSLLSFYHRQIGDAAEKRFLDEGVRMKRHRVMAKYFLDRPLYMQKGEKTKRPDLRKCSELVHHLAEAGMHGELVDTLTGISFLEAKVEAGMAFDLSADFAKALRDGQKHFPKRRTLELIKKALDVDIHFIAGNPSALFQSLWNNCHWHDCASVPDHYSSPVGGWNEKNSPWKRSEDKISPLAESWLGEKARRLSAEYGAQAGGEAPDLKDPGRFYWVKNLRPRSIRLDSPLIMVIAGHEKAVTAAAVSEDGRLVVSGSQDNTVRVWDGVTGRQLHCLKGHSGAINKIAFSADGRKIYSASDDGTVRIWNTAGGEFVKSLAGHEDAVTGVLVLGDGTHLLTSSLDKTLRVWDVANGGTPKVYECPEGAISFPGMSKDGKKIVARLGDKTVQFWNVDPGGGLARGRAVEAVAMCLAVSPANDNFAIAGEDNVIRAFNFQSQKELFSLAGHENRVFGLAFSHDGERLVSCSSDKTIRVWGVFSKKEMHRLTGHYGRVSCAYFFDGSKRIVSGSHDGTVRIWDSSPEYTVGSLKGHEENVRCVDFSSAGNNAVTGGSDGTVRVWETDSGAEKLAFKGHAGSVECVAFSCDGAKVVSGGADKTVRVRDNIAEGGSKSLVGHDAVVTCVACVPGGRLIVSASKDKSVRVWNISSGREKFCLWGHKSEITSIACSPDGGMIAAGAWENIIVWNAISGGTIREIHGPLGNITGLSFSPDGKKMISASDDDTIRIWDVSTWSAVETIAGEIDHRAVAFGLHRARRSGSGLQIVSPDGRVCASYPSAGARVAHHPARPVWALASSSGFDVIELMSFVKELEVAEKPLPKIEIVSLPSGPEPEPVLSPAPAACTQDPKTSAWEKTRCGNLEFRLPPDWRARSTGSTAIYAPGDAKEKILFKSNKYVLTPNLTITSIPNPDGAFDSNSACERFKTEIPRFFKDYKSIETRVIKVSPRESFLLLIFLQNIEGNIFKTTILLLVDRNTIYQVDLSVLKDDDNEFEQLKWLIAGTFSLGPIATAEHLKSYIITVPAPPPAKTEISASGPVAKDDTPFVVPGYKEVSDGSLKKPTYERIIECVRKLERVSKSDAAEFKDILDSGGDLKKTLKSSVFYIQQNENRFPVEFEVISERILVLKSSSAHALIIKRNNDDYIYNSFASAAKVDELKKIAKSLFGGGTKEALAPPPPPPPLKMAGQKTSKPIDLKEMNKKALELPEGKSWAYPRDWPNDPESFYKVLGELLNRHTDGKFFLGFYRGVGEKAGTARISVFSPFGGMTDFYNKFDSHFRDIASELGLDVMKIGGRITQTNVAEPGYTMSDLAPYQRVHESLGKDFELVKFQWGEDRGGNEKMAGQAKPEESKRSTSKGSEKEKAEKISTRPEITIDLGDGVKIEMVLIPAGKFMMGSPDNEPKRSSSEGPVHAVTISKDFYIGKYPVTQEQWKKIMGSAPFDFTNNNRPAGSIAWNEICKSGGFLEKLNKLKPGGHCSFRLPTEAEWEYACRAGTKTAYYWGEKVDGDYCWYHANSGDIKPPVGQKKPNAWGLYDMNGNVWEWCGDWYDDKYYSKSPATDPKGPSSGEWRVMRGGATGGVVDGGGDQRSSRRNADGPVFEHRLSLYGDRGFRLVLEIKK